MGVRSFIKNTVKDNTNVKGWMSWGQVKENGKTVASLFNDLKAPSLDVSAKKLTFEQMIKQLNLTEADLSARMRSCFQSAILCVLFGLAAFGWAGYLLSKLMFLSGLVSLALAALMFAYAFREHFTYFQIKQKRLDCTLKEWFFSFFSKK